MALAPKSTEFLDTLGAILLRTGSPEEAVDRLDKAWSESGGARPDVGVRLSKALMAVGKKSQAAALLRRLLAGNKAFPERAEAQNLLRQIGG